MSLFCVSLLTPSHLFVLLSVAFSLLGSTVYIKDTLAGKTTPNRMTWSMWAVASSIVGGSAYSAGADAWITARVFVGSLCLVLVLWSSYHNPNGHWELGPFDAVCGVCSTAALVMWLATGFDRAALLLAIIACASAALPTIGKSWTAPKTETGVTYAFYFASALVILPAIPMPWTFENYGFQVYLLIVSAIILVGVYREKMRAWLRMLNVA